MQNEVLEASDVAIEIYACVQCLYTDCVECDSED
jgi:hypothetical protein